MKHARAQHKGLILAVCPKIGAKNWVKCAQHVEKPPRRGGTQGR